MTTVDILISSVMFEICNPSTGDTIRCRANKYICKKIEDSDSRGEKNE